MADDDRVVHIVRRQGQETRGDRTAGNRCEWCGNALDPSYVLADFGVCHPCHRKLDDAFIAGFGLVEGAHYEKDAAGVQWPG